MKSKVILFVGVFITVFSSAIKAEEATLIMFNGKVITVDTEDHIYQAIAVKGAKILALGNDVEIKSLAGPNCIMIDLKGKTVTPGLIDSHYHLMYYGAQFWPGYLNIRFPVATNKSDLLKVVGDYAKQLSPGVWISGNQGFALLQGETLDRWDLDAVSPNNPVYLRHTSGQYSVVNSKALEIAGVDSSTPNPHSSLIMHDSLGNPNGVLSHYPAENLIGKYATGYGDRSDEQRLEDLEVGQSLCLQAGYTSIQDVILGSLNDVLLNRQFAEDGRLKVRVYSMILIDTKEEADMFSLLTMPANTGLFTFGGWKLAMDGGLGGRTTLFYDKSLYASQISYPYHSQEEMNYLVKKLHNTGYQVAVHVGGDEGIDMTLTAFEQALQENPRPDPRHRIEHGLFPTTSALQRIKDDNIILSTQPQWITWYGDGFTALTNEATMNYLLPLKTMLNMGIHIAFGCDVPASIYQEPKWAFAGSVFRRTGAGTLLTQNERLSIQEALRIHTMGSAYAGFAELTTGSLEPGKFADIVMWSNDIYNLSFSDLNKLEAEITIVGGEVVYDKNNVTSIQHANQNIPASFQLLQNYPNPFNPGTIIKYGLPEKSIVKLEVYNTLGEQVAQLVNEIKDAGYHQVKWNTTGLASGAYFYSIYSQPVNGSKDFRAVKKMLLLK